jgi:predicted lipoprotein
MTPLVKRRRSKSKASVESGGGEGRGTVRGELRTSTRVAPLAVLLSVVIGLSGCKVLSVAEDAALRDRASAGFDAARFADQIWDARARPFWSETARPIDGLASRLHSDLEGAGRESGRQAGDGSPWTFVVSGEGVVRALDGGRRGRAVVEIAGSAEPVILQIGPVVSGAYLRDSLPFVQFNDFANQLVYADVAQALTAKGLEGVVPVARTLAVGDRVRFAGVLAMASAGDPRIVTPFEMERIS